MTVSRVLDVSGWERAKVRPTTRERVEAVAERMGYRPNVAARSLRSNRTHQIGVYIKWKDYVAMGSSGWMRVFSALQRQASEHNYRLAFHFHDQESEADLRELFTPGRYMDGLVVLGRNLSDVEVGLLNDCGMPTVSLYHRIADFCCLLADDGGVGRRAADYLHSRGHRKVAVLSHRTPREEWNGRFHGFVTRAGELGLEVSMQVFHACERRNLNGWERDFGYTETPLPGSDQAFSALWVTSDFVAVGAVQRLEDEGLVVGKDVSVLSYDNAEGHGYAFWEQPRLTSFDLARDKIGIAAADVLCSGSFSPDIHLFSSQLVERGSVCDGPAGAVAHSLRQTF